MDADMTSAARELAQRNRELTILNDITAALNQEVDMTAALNTALQRVAELLELRTGWIWLLPEDAIVQPYLAAALNLPPGLRDDPLRMEGTCYCLRTYAAGDMDGVANINVVSCSRLAELVDGTDGLRYHTSVPLYASHGKKLGILNVAGSNWRELSDADLRLLRTIGDLLSITIERARLFARSRQIGVHEERGRLAREIHDTLGQNLAAITLQMETADALFESGAEPDEVWAIVRKTLDLSREGLLEARRSILDLRAVPLEGKSLHLAIERLLDDASMRTGLRIDYFPTGAQFPLPVRLEVAVYRIVQEALSNIERHAAAGHVRVALSAVPGILRLVVEDDGLGFQPTDIPIGRYGLMGMNERVHLLGGHLDLQSSPGQGTRLRIDLPLDAAEE